MYFLLFQGRDPESLAASQTSQPMCFLEAGADDVKTVTCSLWEVEYIRYCLTIVTLLFCLFSYFSAISTHCLHNKQSVQ